MFGGPRTLGGEMKHYYREQVRMDPRDGKSYSTTFIKQSATHRRDTAERIARIHDKVFQAKHIEKCVRDWCEEPLKRSIRRQGNLAGTRYTRWDAIQDAHRQMNTLQHDMTVSISNRWNRALEGTGHEMEWVLESQSPDVSRFNLLFDRDVE